MRGLYIIAGGFIIAALGTASGLKNLSQASVGQTSQKVSTSGSSAANPLKPQYSQGTSSKKRRGTVVLKAGRGGHFHPTAKLNNRSFKVLVDTGATAVAINRSTARKIGLNLKSSDFRYKVSTANGMAKAASAMIKSISIGGIKVTLKDGGKSGRFENP